MTFKELQDEVSSRLELETVSVAFWTVDDVKTSINEGYEEISDATEWYEREATIPLLANRTYYDMRTAIGADVFLAPGRAWNDDTQRWMEPIGMRDLDDRTYRRWEVNTGEPQRVFQRGIWWIGTHPKQAADTGTMRLYYTALPPALQWDSDAPGFEREYHPALIEYALFDLLAQEGSSDLALAHYAEYQKIEAALTGHVSGRIGTDRIQNVKSQRNA